MLATLLLQLSPVDLLHDGQTNSAALLPDAGEQAKSGFAQLLRLRVDASPAPELAGGELPVIEGEPLPSGGKFLPLDDMLPTALLPTEQALGDDIEQDADLSYPADLALLTTLQTEPLPALLSVPASGPHSALPALAEQSPTSRLLPAAGVERNIERPIARADIAFNSGVVYPASPDSPAEGPDSIELRPSRQPVAPVVRIDARAAEVPVNDRGAVARLEPRADTSATPSVTRTELAARTQDFFTTSGERIETAAHASAGMRERSQAVSPEPRILPNASAPGEGEIVDERLQRDAARLSDQLQPQRLESVRDTGVEIARLRSAVQQPAPTPHGQAATQSSQAVQTVMNIATAASDIDTSATVRQSTDLVNTPVRDSAWGERIGERVVLMAGKNFQSAEIRLTPAELGPLRVRISVDDGAANVTFHAQHAVTRDALEQAMPRLREMFAESGLTLGQADVAEQGVAGRDRDGQATSQPIQQSADEADDSVPHDAAEAPQRADKADSLVDTFA